MRNINLFLTFDYELPLGGIKHSFEHSLFNPTDKLLDLANSLDVPIILFADILSYIRFKELGITEYCQAFEKQIDRALKEGHDVQLHLHSHWLETEVSDKTFIPSKRFSLADFADDEKYTIENIVKLGVDELTRICRKTKPDYKCIAFRAGGYSIQRETKRIVKALYENGIRIDSSIAKGYKYYSDMSQIDFSYKPNKPNWVIPIEDGDLTYDGNEKMGLLEVPIASKPKTVFDTPTFLKLKKYKHREVENRGSIIHNEKTKWDVKIRNMSSSRMLILDNHTFNIDDLMSILNYNLKIYRDFETINLCLIGHPKSMGEYHLQLFDDFINEISKKHKDKIQFKNITQL